MMMQAGRPFPPNLALAAERMAPAAPGVPEAPSRSGDAGVHQHPIAVAGVLETDEDDVDNRKLTIGDVSDDLPRAVVAVEVGLRVLRVGGRGKRDLRHVHSGPM